MITFCNFLQEVIEKADKDIRFVYNFVLLLIF